MSDNPILRAALRQNAAEPNMDQHQTIEMTSNSANAEFDLRYQQRTVNLLIERCNGQKGLMLMALLKGLLRRAYLRLHPDERMMPFEVKMVGHFVIVERVNGEQILVEASTPKTLSSLVESLGCFKVPLTLEALRVAVLEYDWPPDNVLAFAGKRPDVPSYVEVVGYDYDDVLAYDAQMDLHIQSRRDLAEQIEAQELNTSDSKKSR